MTDKIVCSLGPFDRSPDAKIRALVRLALSEKKELVKAMIQPLVVEACARGRVVPDARRGRLAPAPPMTGQAADLYFAPIRLGIRDAMGSTVDYEVRCTEAKGPMGLTLLVYEKPQPQTDAKSVA